MIPDHLPDCSESFLEAIAPILYTVLEPTVTLLQIVAYGGLTLVAVVAILSSILEDNKRNNP
uniref:Holin n=1 Tax=Aeromonas phage vB_AdhaP_MF TaxID=3367373 RepID=A0AB74UPB5_9CAUD